MALVLFVLMWVGYQQRWSWVDQMDDLATSRFSSYGQAHPGWVGLNSVISTAFGPMSFRILGVILAAIALTRRAYRMAIFLVVTVGAGGMVNEIVKQMSDRQRPTAALVDAFSSSFPSGHSFGVVVGVLAIGAALWPLLRRQPRQALVLVDAVLVIAVGFSRVALVVHHVSDVIAGWSWGFLWWTVCFVVIRPTKDRVWSELVKAKAAELTEGDPPR